VRGVHITGTGDDLQGGAGSDSYVFGRGDGEAVIFDDAAGAVAGSLVGGATDSLSARIAGITAGSISRNWAGNGDYTVDGSVKGGEDAIVFRAGLTMNDLVIERSGTTGNPGRDLIIILVTKVAVPISAQYPTGLRTDRTGDKLVIKDWFEGTRRIEWLRFANGDDIRIGDVTSFLIGTGGNDVIIGTNGADFLYGGDGNDTLFGLKGNDFGIGGRGNDLVSGDDDNDWVSGGDDNDKVLGGRGNDTVFGDEGNDDVYGGDGNDLVVGGQGNDTVIGGAGDDVFRFNRGDGQDILIDELNGTWELVWDGNIGGNGNKGYINGYVFDNATGTVSKAGTVKESNFGQEAANDNIQLRNAG
jgi:Ca2+-binding RTX toxin-like protein